MGSTLGDATTTMTECCNGLNGMAYMSNGQCIYIYHFAWEDQRELQGNIRQRAIYFALSRGQYSDIAWEGGF